MLGWGLNAPALSQDAERAPVPPLAPGTSDERLRRMLQRAPDAPAVSPQAREQLLADGEAALLRGDVERAAALFEQAGFVKHAADAELGLIRTYMQSGQYRRALTFAAHTAGAHPDVAAGSGLYAWLLHLGGQSQVAARILDRARGRLPDDALLEATGALLKAAQPLPHGLLLDAPARYVPYSPDSSALPASVRAVGSGVVVDDGRAVLTQALPIAPGRSVWVRDGLGRVRTAVLERSADAAGLALLRLDAALDPGATLAAPRDPFPGSPIVAIEFVSAAGAQDPQPRWPVLRLGFLGQPAPQHGRYGLGMSMPAGPRGGPVYDMSGQLIGVATSAGEHADELLAPSLLSGNFPAVIARAPVPQQRLQSAGLDELYERGLRGAVQILMAP